MAIENRTHIFQPRSASDKVAHCRQYVWLVRTNVVCGATLCRPRSANLPANPDRLPSCYTCSLNYNARFPKGLVLNPLAEASGVTLRPHVLTRI
jgi:hypothetical protein